MSSLTKQKEEPAPNGFWSELFQFGLYKPNQGRIVRQITFAAMALLGSLGAWELYRSGALAGLGGVSHLLLIALIMMACWFAFRIVNYSTFAGFLIAVEAEMNKVSWPTKNEVWNAALVVMFVIFAMATFLFLFDLLWTFVFELIGIRYSDSGSIVVGFFRWIRGG
jgi:preprotein translocase subunit SecE